MNVTQNKGETPLMTCVLHDNIWALQILLAHGADIHAKDRDGKTALDLALEKKPTEIAKVLINKGAKVNLP